MEIELIKACIFFLLFVKDAFSTQILTTGVTVKARMSVKITDDPDETIMKIHTWNHCMLLCVHKQTCEEFNYHGDSSRCEMYTTAGCKNFDISTGWRLGYIEADRQRNTTSRNINVALNKPTYQSSTFDGIAYGSPTGFAANAVDGGTNTEYMSGSCTHTKHEPNPWWIVDLGKSYYIDRIVIWNRKTKAHRLHDFSIDTACHFDGVNPDNTNWTRQHLHVGTLDVNPKVMPLPNSAFGRFVKIEKTVPTVTDQNLLTLCEVEIYVV
ncbi:unnamed protein product [Owenia fusiformis]|uniref:Uncharacterized protein n=1 Tax=Owenia fusiformis TaxID=6347 RepID=A0A8J1UI22_OWEFU|nr:unnamed protein product [Owenia fusiformis]